MNKLLFKIILIGILLGVIATSITMFFGIAIYYGLEALELFLSVYFLNYAAWTALAIGVTCTLAWYIYMLIVARQFFKDIMKSFCDNLAPGGKGK